MIESLARFVEELRRRGMRPSPAETLDAARAVESVGIEDRERFRVALRATLAKHRSRHELFDRAFDAFFRAPAPETKKRRRRRKASGTSGGRPRGRSEAGAPRQPVPRKEPGRGFGESIDRVRHGSRSGRLRRVRLAPRSHETGSAEAHDPMRRELRRVRGSDADRELARMVPEIIERLRLRSGRRLRRASHGRVWARRVFRENLAWGGVPFVLPFRRRRKKRPNVVLLVDVSYSVTRAAGYFVRIASEFLRPGRRARVFLFVDRPVDATASIARWNARGGERFPDLLRSLDDLNLEAASDYGRAFHALLHRFPFGGGRDTVLVILGDARTNRFEPLAWTLAEMARRCRTVVWLVPEPRARWGTGDSALASYLENVDVIVEAPDLAGLERGIGEILRRL